MDHSVCLSVCLSVRSHNSKTTRPNFKFLCMLPVAVVRSSSDGVAICCVLLVSRTTAYFHTVGPMGRIKHDVRRVRQVAVPVGRQTTTNSVNAAP